MATYDIDRFVGNDHHEKKSQWKLSQNAKNSIEENPYENTVFKNGGHLFLWLGVTKDPFVNFRL